jgi:hypothetical protein
VDFVNFKQIKTKPANKTSFSFEKKQVGESLFLAGMVTNI